jgi:uncharacterized protein DUF87
VETYEKLGSFYLGKTVEMDGQAQPPELVLYDSKDLTTHAVIIGMTGSGKTGLGVALLEEALLDKIPVIAIDPKGDLTNLALTFPGMQAEDLKPWVNPQEALAKGKTVDAYAVDEACKWTDGLAQWGQDTERITRLKNAAELKIYTPGSSAGASVSLLRKFSAPPDVVRNDPDLFSERIETTTSSLMALLDLDADPISSREHILVANIFSHTWQEGQGLDLAGLIQAIQDPPFERVGIMNLDSFYPAKDRFTLAMRINNLLAAPGFGAWLEGTPLNIPDLLHTPTGQPRASVFTISHLSDSQRMFFVSMLLNELLGWMRTQPGTTSLRAILYMDEVFGYFPPVSNPPSKTPLLRLLKQARAFGLGVVLATQNPVDLDYRGLSNTGTWLIGRLQTERDQMRVMDGLQGGALGGHMDTQRLKPILAGLESRTFLLHNVHESGPVVFKSRWALSYLRGPLTREQIKQLGPQITAPELSRPPGQTAIMDATPGLETRPAPPALPPDIPVYYVRGSGAGQEGKYLPHVFGQMEIYYSSAKYKVDQARSIALATPLEDGPVPFDWDAAVALSVDAGTLETEPMAGASYGELPSTALKLASYRKWQKDLRRWLKANQPVTLLRCKALKLTSSPEESEGDFRSRMALALHEKRDLAVEQLRRKYARRFQTLKNRLMTAEQAIAREEEQAKARQVDTVISFGTAILGAFLGRKTVSARSTSRVGTAMKSAGRMRKEKMDVARAQERAASVGQQMAELEVRLQEDIDKLEMKFDPESETLEEVRIAPKLSDISMAIFGLAWLPYRKNDQGRFVPDWRDAD